jgi:mannosyltransferase PIG-V
VRDTLLAPAARWDSVWYLRIADHGYLEPSYTNFFPLFPLLARAAGTPVASSLLGGLLVSLVSLLVGLYLLHKLTALELGDEYARRTVLLTAFFPTALFFSAVYPEGLLLALSVGAFYAARTGRWAWAGAAGGLAAMTRPQGVLVLVPLLLLYLYGPRGDRADAPSRSGLRPRYALSSDVLWLLAVPAGLAVHMAYLGLVFDDPLALFRHKGPWHQEFTFPLVTLWRATEAAVSGFSGVFHGQPPDDVWEFGAVCFACVCTVGALRRLPLAYGAYAATGIVLLLSYPTYGIHPASFSRFMTPLFPILMWLAVWSSERRLFKPILVAFALLMVVNSARFATWHWVA